MFGGQSRFGNSGYLRKIFQFLPAHQRIRITGKYHILDSWDLAQREAFVIYLDGKVVYERLFDHNGNVEILSQCGQAGTSNGDLINQDFVIDIPHTESSFLLAFYSNLNEDPAYESWGISDLKIELLAET